MATKASKTVPSAKVSSNQKSSSKLGLLGGNNCGFHSNKFQFRITQQE